MAKPIFLTILKYIEYNQQTDLTKIISLCGAPVSGKFLLAAELAVKMSSKHSIIFENKLIISGEKNGHCNNIDLYLRTFDDNYKGILYYMLTDMKNRTFAEQNKVDYVIYKESIFDKISMIQTNNDLNETQKSYLTEMLSSHESLFPSDVIVYCEPMEMTKDLLDEKSEMKRLQIDSNLMQILESKNIEFLAAKKTDKSRSDYILSKILNF